MCVFIYTKTNEGHAAGLMTSMYNSLHTHTDKQNGSEIILMGIANEL